MRDEKLKIIVLILLLGLLALVVLLPNNPIFRKATTEDSGMFLYHGQQILQGRIPYRDVWEHKGPVILYINALGLAISNGSRWGVWLLEFLTIFGSSILGFVVFKRIFGIIPALFSSILWITSLVFVLEGGNLTEEYNILLQFLAVFLFFKSGFKNLKWRGFLIGLIFAISFFLKQNLTGVFIAIVITRFALLAIEKKKDYLLKDLSLIFAGFAALALVVLIYFYANSALNFFLDGIFRFNFVYSSTTFLSRLKAIFMGFWILARSGLSFIALASFLFGIYYLWVLKKKNAKVLFPFLLFALIAFPLELVLASTSGVSPPHYFTAWLYVFAIFAGFFGHFLKELAKNLSSIFLFSFLFSIIIMPFGLLIYEYKPDSNFRICKDIGWFLLPSSQYFECSNTKIKASEYVKANTLKTDYLLMWGFGGSVNFQANRVSPSRFTYQYPLFKEQYQSKQMVKDFVEDVIMLKPKIIIDTTSSYGLVPSIDASERKKWLKGIILPEMNKLFQYFDTHYEFVGTIGQDEWLVYKYNKR